MKKIPVLLAILLLSACNDEQKINGHSDKSVYKSMQMIKLQLPQEIRIEYEISFELLRKTEKDNDKFFNRINGKTPSELVAMGKEIYRRNKTEGIREYQTYQSWEDLIHRYQQENVRLYFEFPIARPINAVFIGRGNSVRNWKCGALL
jgi:hypothetical protein